MIDLHKTMLTFNLTTNIPIQLYSSEWILLHALDRPNAPFKYLNCIDISTLKKHMLKQSYYIFHTDYYENYIIWRYDDLYQQKNFFIIGPTKSFLPSKYELKQFLLQNKQHINNYNKLLLYYKNLKTVPLGSYNHYFIVLSKLFETSNPVLFSNQQCSIDDISLSKRKIDYVTSSFYHHNYLLEKEYLDKAFNELDFNIDITPLEPALLSNEFIRNNKNVCICMISLVARYAIENGLDSHIAFTTSDHFIHKIEAEENYIEYEFILEAAIRKFKKLIDLSAHHNYSKYLTQAIQYIENNLTAPITLTDVANHVHLSKDYLSKLFRKEINISFKQYLLKERVSSSKDMLNYTHYSLSDIADRYCFSSKSHFIQCFKNIENITPHKYRLKRSDCNNTF